MLDNRVIAVRFLCLIVGEANMHDKQGRNEVRWRPGQEASLAPPCSKLRSFGSKFTVLQKVLVTLLGLFGARRSDLALGELCPPCPLSLRPL